MSSVHTILCLCIGACSVGHWATLIYKKRIALSTHDTTAVKWVFVFSATMFCKSLLLQSCLLKFVLSFHANNFFPNGQVASDIKVTSTEATLSFSPDIGLGCGAVSTKSQYLCYIT